MPKEVEYEITQTSFGTWRRYVYPTGNRFAEFRSAATVAGWPLVHYTCGPCPETGKRIVAKGVIAVGRLAVGALAVGQASLGLIAVGQAGIGLLFGLGQLTSGIACVGQVAIGVSFALGQVAVASTAIGQVAKGTYVLAQVGFGEFVWSMKRADPAAVHHFRQLWASVSWVFGM